MPIKGYSTFPYSSSITIASPLDCSVSYPEHSSEESYPSAVIQSVYSAAPPTDWDCLCMFYQIRIGCNTRSIFKTVFNRFDFRAFLIQDWSLYWPIAIARCPWCNGYRRKKWIRRHEFKILDETDCISHSTNTLGKGMNPIILPPAMGKIVGQTGFFSLDKATSLGEGKLRIQTC